MAFSPQFLLHRQPTSDVVYTPCPSKLSPWLAPLAYKIGKRVVLPNFFRTIRIVGQENIPTSGPVVFAPTHRSRWDALLIGLVGHQTTRRYLRFMVTADECLGMQGWAIKRLGGFPVDVRRPAIATLRHGLQLLQNRQTLVIFPEGDIFRQKQVQCLKPGLARLALQAEQSTPNLGVKILPIYLDYDSPHPSFGSSVEVRIAPTLSVSNYMASSSAKQQALRLTADLKYSLESMANIEQPLELAA
ncbi:phospholipid glycerol acyltransferase [Leptolyngbya sp. Heron Island J]|uniref:lysophospholipid acyltransferase family protein n=1 Tax=Leptolyngbya sp. Heron Island J TaxID=1385935 RepID=UPI0003B9C733|nr:1-acyl-sn-glycerol-3-phosphate acyltransferase [Leptolyngbya sp. Heron Island J]ESA34999.1 phospholipid glycerol acyltransferase [Leptolyngbya sp. Heron Island J]